MAGVQPTTNQDVIRLADAWRLLLRLLVLIRHYWPLIAKGLGIGLATGLVGMATPYISKLLIDQAFPTRDVSLMHVLVGGILGISVVSAGLGAVRSYYTQIVGAQLSTAGTLMFFNHVLHLPVRFFDRHRVGEIMSRFQDLNGAMGAVSRVFETVLLRGVYLLLVPPMLFLLNWRLALLSVVTLPLTTVIGVGLGRLLRRYHKRSAEAQAELHAFNVETLSQVRMLKGLAAERWACVEADRQLRQALGLRLSAGGLGTVLGLVNGGIRAGGHALFTWFGWTLILRGELTLGGYIAFTAYQGYLVGPLSEFASLFVSFQQTAVTFGRAFEYLDEVPEQDPAPSFLPVQPIQCELRGALSLEGVGFAYVPDQPVLRGIDLTIAPGEMVAVVGPSGAGKSSLFRLLSRLEEPDRGLIRADGRAYPSLSLADVRRQVAVVPQEVALIRGTVRENLMLGLADVDDNLLDDAVQACQLHDVIQGLPGGYDTAIAEWGASLSGGQRQRIAIARALLRRAPILLLDEATSNLDVETEAALIKALLGRLPRPTLILATHRLATAELADRIVVLERGTIVGVGTHGDLMATCDVYRALQGQGRVLAGRRGSMAALGGAP